MIRSTRSWISKSVQLLRSMDFSILSLSYHQAMSAWRSITSSNPLFMALTLSV